MLLVLITVPSSNIVTRNSVTYVLICKIEYEIYQRKKSFPLSLLTQLIPTVNVTACQKLLNTILFLFVLRITKITEIQKHSYL